MYFQLSRFDLREIEKIRLLPLKPSPQAAAGCVSIAHGNFYILDAGTLMRYLHPEIKGIAEIVNERNAIRAANEGAQNGLCHNLRHSRGFKGGEKSE